MTAADSILTAHAFATLAMAGVIWFVQVVHYPLLARVGRGEFVAYEREHVRRTTFVVAPLMLIEVATATWLVFVPPAPHLTWATAVGLGLVTLIWSSTAVLQVPCHRRLERGFDPAVVRRLVATNWVRTSAWTARAALVVYLIAAR